MALRLGLPDHVVYQQRHQNRELWYRIGKEVRFNDPGILLREAFENGSVSGGVRDYEEVVYARESGLVDLIVWVDRPVPKTRLSSSTTPSATSPFQTTAHSPNTTAALSDLQKR